MVAVPACLTKTWPKQCYQTFTHLSLHNRSNIGVPVIVCSNSHDFIQDSVNNGNLKSMFADLEYII